MGHTCATSPLTPTQVLTSPFIPLSLSMFAYKPIHHLLAYHLIVYLYLVVFFFCEQNIFFSYEHEYGVHDVYDPITLLEIRTCSSSIDFLGELQLFIMCFSWIGQALSKLNSRL